MESKTIENQFEAMKPLFEKYISKLLKEQTIATEQQIRQISLLERIVRVEEELKALRELSEQRFAASDKRFEEMQSNMDKRFEDMKNYSDRRFTQLTWVVSISMTLIATLMALFKFII